MSHEFRTPMNAIMGFSQILKVDNESSLNKSQTESVDETLSASNHLLSLIDEIWNITKLESGSEFFKTEDVHIGLTIIESLKLVSGMIEKRGIDVEILIDSQLIASSQLEEQSLYVIADGLKLKQVIINLLSNAVKYNSEHGKITINCEKSEYEQITVSVSDTGVGLTTEKKL